MFIGRSHFLRALWWYSFIWIFHSHLWCLCTCRTMIPWRSTGFPKYLTEKMSTEPDGETWSSPQRDMTPSLKVSFQKWPSIFVISVCYRLHVVSNQRELNYHWGCLGFVSFATCSAPFAFVLFLLQCLFDRFGEKKISSLTKWHLDPSCKLWNCIVCSFPSGFQTCSYSTFIGD